MSEIFKITCPSGISDETKRIEKSIPRDTASTTSISKIKAELDAAKKYKSQIENSEKEIEKVKKMLK